MSVNQTAPRPRAVSASSRRAFLTSAGGGLGMMALASLLQRDGLGAPAGGSSAGPNATPTALTPRPPHFAPRVKNCIFLFMDGGPSQFDLYEHRPLLAKYDGQKLPASFTKDVRFAFLDKDSSTLMAPKHRFMPHGESGIELSDLLPHLAGCVDDLCLVRTMQTEQFNHHPAQLLLHCGRAEFGLPTVGSWLVYGLGSQSQDLPGYVVLSSGRGASGGVTNWSSGFMPSSLQGMPFRNQGEPVLNLRDPPGLPVHLRRAGLDALADLNQLHQRDVLDPEVASRIASYELAFRMQSAAPELCDLSDETDATLQLYGVDRTDPAIKAERSGGPNQYRGFATNCLLARRLVERGVRFVHLIHGTWDHHSNLDIELPFNATMADQPLAALITDLKQRGLLDETLVVWTSEFGRTPLGEYRRGKTTTTGRDHHPFAFSTILCGGGVKAGHVHGELDDFGWAPVRDAVHVNDFHATLLHLFGLDHERLTYKFQGLDHRLPSITRESRVVTELLG